jgi:hypothetical protein
MGFLYKKVNNRNFLTEQPHVKVSKLKFIKQFMKYLQSNEIVFYILRERNA